MTHRALLLAPDLSGNSSLTPWAFSGALSLLGIQGEILGPATGELWPPLAEELAGATRLPSPWAGAGIRLPGPLDGAAAGAGLVYAFKAYPSSLLPGLRLSRRHGLPLAVHLDDWDGGYFQGRSRWKRLWWAARAAGNPSGEGWLRLCEQLLPRADVLTVSTRALQRRFGGTVVRQGVDTRAISPEAYPRARARERLGIPQTSPMILFLGTPRPHKGLTTLLAHRELASAVWIVGGHRDDLVALGLEGDDLSRIQLRPPQPYRDAVWYTAACDVFVVPQEDTPFAAHQLPAKLLMAMALGVPVVTTDVGDAGELLGGEPPAGVVVPPGEPDALWRGVEGVLAHPETARDLGIEARKRSHRMLGWPAMARTLAPLLPRNLLPDAEGDA